MSINVTVTGNPVSIKRGKMVTATESSLDRNEFKKRRKIRLEQVRQQSREIAESVRNKVRKGMNSELLAAEKNNEVKLREWQNKKLLNLQNQYQESLKEIGLGHTQAAMLQKQELEELIISENINSKNARERGLQAEQTLQILQNEQKLKNALPLQKKLMSREVENTRAAMISNSNKKKCKKKVPAAKINISKETYRDSDLESEAPIMVNITTDNIDNSSYSESDDESSIVKQSVNKKLHGKNKKSTNHQKASSQHGHKKSKKKKSLSESEPDWSSDIGHKGKEYSTGDKLRSPRRMENQDSNFYKRQEKEHINLRNHIAAQQVNGPRVEEYQTTDLQEKYKGLSKVPIDTRISDRIKKRNMVAPQTTTDPKQAEYPYYQSSYNGNLKEDQFMTKTNTHSLHSGPKKPIICACGHPLNEKCDCDLGASYVDQHKKSKYKPMGEIANELQIDIQNESDVMDIADIQRSQEANRPIKSATHSTQNAKSQSQKNSKPSISSSKPASTLELPTLPTKSLRTPSVKPPSTSEFSKVQYYDHNYRFNKESIRDNSNVHKISESSVEIMESKDFDDDSVDIQERLFRREHEAEVRGQRAMEKERIHRSNIDVLGKLKRLQPRERIASINPSNGEAHMSQQRLKERGNKRQNAIENAFESLFPNTITIPQKNHQQQQCDNVPFKALTISGSEQPLNQSKWDSTVINGETKIEDLSALLTKLKGHKDELLKEAGVVTHSSLTRLINELEKSVKIGNKAAQSEPISSSSLETPSDMRKSLKTPKHKSKKHKQRKGILILQNMSTQTSPNIAKKLVDEQITVTADVHDTQSVTCLDPQIVKNRKDGKNLFVDTVDQNIVPADKKVITSSVWAQESHGTVNSGENICEILIKLNHKDQPAVVVTSLNKREEILLTDNLIPRDERLKSITNDQNPAVNIIKRGGETAKTSKAPKTKHKTKKSRPEPILSSSTSYYSPPNYTSPDDAAGHNPSSLTHLLQKKTQQSNLTPKYIAPNLLTYIKKLLTMTKGSIENLAISSVSDVSTPNSSIVNTYRNSHTDLPSVLRYFNLNMDDVQANINAEKSGGSPKLNQTTFQHVDTSKTNQLPLNRDNAEQSNMLTSTDDVTDTFAYNATGGSGYDASQSQNANQNENQRSQNREISVGVDSYSLSKTGDATSRLHDVREMSLEDYSMQRYPNIITKYSELADTCMKRITNLEILIEKVRSEKQQMLSPNRSTDKETSTTQYLNLPSQFGDDTNVSDGSTSPEQKKLTEQLLQLNRQPNQTYEDNDPLSSPNNTFEADLIKRYLTLKHNVDSLNTSSSKIKEKSPDNRPRPTERSKSPRNMSSEVKSKSPDARSGNPENKLKPKSPNTVEEFSELPYAPLLLDIPKLPKLTRIAEVSEISESSGHKRPPPAKGLSSARRYNDNITAIPHELSTIIEGDSRNRSKSPDGFFSQKSTPIKDVRRTQRFDEMLTPFIVLPDPPSVLEKKSSDDSLPDVVTDSRHPTQPVSVAKPFNKTKNREELINAIRKIQEISTDESSDKSELDVEAMLKSMGMGWAVATLRKTQEALAKSSSTSSFESSTPKVSNSSSEVSLKDFLRNINLTSDSVSPFSKELNDISAIQGSATSVDKQQRTSTPVHTTRSTDKSKNESAISKINTASSNSHSSGKNDVLIGTSDVSSPQEDSNQDSKSMHFASMAGNTLEETTF